MYGVPSDLDLSLFVGATLIQIALGEYQVQFHFQVTDVDARRPDPYPYLSVEGHWELADGAGCTIDRAEPNSTREAYRLHRLLGNEVTGTSVDPPRSFTLCFNSGLQLRVFDDSEEFESFSIMPGDIYV